MTKDELLAVLDLSENKQYLWLTEKGYFQYPQKNCLADLAFRLRDEAEKIKPYWLWDSGAMKAVWEKFAELDLPPAHEGYVVAHRWFVNMAKPIHWIIAALIAKGQE